MAEYPAQMSKTKAIFLTVFLVFMTAAPFLMAGKQLVSDFVNGPKWEMALDLTITEAKCTRYAFVIARCTTRFASVSQPALVQPILGYFSFGSWGGEVAILTRSAKNPQAITTQLAIRDLNLRLVSMCVWALAGLALTLAFVIKVFAPGRSHRIESAPTRLSRDLPSSRAAFGGFAPPPQPDVSFRNPEIFAPAAQPLYQPQVTAKPATSGAEGGRLRFPQRGNEPAVQNHRHVCDVYRRPNHRQLYLGPRLHRLSGFRPGDVCRLAQILSHRQGSAFCV